MKFVQLRSVGAALSKKKSKRDDFRGPTIQELVKRVGYRCSRPDCRVSTIGPAMGGGSSSIGTAAHITAAAAGGPRYDAALSIEERRSYANGIWLCAIHGREVDSDHHRYSADELRRWKSEAEEYALQQLGRRQPQESDAAHMLVMASSGQGGVVLRDGVGRFHRALQNAIAKMDPRFRIRSSYVNGRTSYVVEALQHATVQMSISGDLLPSEFERKYADLKEHGLPLEIANASIHFLDSDALNALVQDRGPGVLSIGPVPRRGQVRLKLMSRDGSHSIDMAPAAADVFGGESTARFVARAYDGLVKVEIVAPLDDNPPTLSLDINLTSWGGKNILRLPHFDDLRQFVVNAAMGWELHVGLHLEEHGEVQKGVLDLSKTDLIRWNAAFMIYAHAVRSIARRSQTKVLVDFERFQIDEEANAIVEASAALSETTRNVPKFQVRAASTANVAWSPSSDGVWRSPIVRLWTPAHTLCAFGAQLEIPAMTRYVTNVEMRLICENGACETVASGTEESVMTTVIGEDPR